MVLQHFLIPRERPINKADKSGAVQIKLGGESRTPAAQLKDTQKPGRGLVGPLRGEKRRQKITVLSMTK